MADDPDRSPARARELSTIKTVGDRVAYIAGLMERFEWDTRRSKRELAQAWDVAESTVQNYSAEATRLCTGDADEARRDITVGARKLLREAVQNGRATDFSRVAEVWATVSGAKAPERHQIGALEAATPGKAREVMSELFGAVTPQGIGPNEDPER